MLNEDSCVNEKGFPRVKQSPQIQNVNETMSNVKQRNWDIGYAVGSNKIWAWVMLGINCPGPKPD